MACLHNASTGCGDHVCYSCLGCWILRPVKAYSAYPHGYRQKLQAVASMTMAWLIFRYIGVARTRHLPHHLIICLTYFIQYPPDGYPISRRRRWYRSTRPTCHTIPSVSTWYVAFPMSFFQCQHQRKMPMATARTVVSSISSIPPMFFFFFQNSVPLEDAHGHSSFLLCFLISSLNHDQTFAIVVAGQRRLKVKSLGPDSR
jgi:hypothetical protein